jgi:hypothetical protein
MINTRHFLAIRYNDKSVLENYHIASAFEIMAKKETNIFANLEFEEYKQIREKMIGMVLATDMSLHFGEIGKLKTRVRSGKVVY